MPADAGEAAGVAELVGQASALLLFGAANDADLVAELAAFFCKRVDVEAGGFGLFVISQLEDLGTMVA